MAPSQRKIHRAVRSLDCSTFRTCDSSLYCSATRTRLVFYPDTLADFVFHELMVHLIGCLAPRGERRIIIRSFVEACCSHIADRMLELVERSKAARTSNGRELVLVKGAAIKAYMKEHDIHLRTTRISGSANVNEAAKRAGHAAGTRASLGRPISGDAGVLRLGKS
jgi:hypothetical protein